jgi:hypothetical protein
MSAYARELGLDVDAITLEFTEYWWQTAGAKGRKADWDLTWKTWCRRAADKAGSSAGRVPLLPGVAATSAVAPNDDPWGIEAFCRSINATPITDPEHLKRGKWMHSGAIIDSIARNVAEHAGFARTMRVDWRPLLDWLAAGVHCSDMYLAVKRQADRMAAGGDPAQSIKVFSTNVLDRIPEWKRSIAPHRSAGRDDDAAAHDSVTRQLAALEASP